MELLYSLFLIIKFIGEQTINILIFRGNVRHDIFSAFIPGWLVTLLTIIICCSVLVYKIKKAM